MQRPMKAGALMAGLALTATMAMAQAPAPATGASAPAAVGVSNGTAAEANQKAVPRSDTATVVRTSPSAADKTRSATANVGAGNSGNASMSGTPVTRAPKADRN